MILKIPLAFAYSSRRNRSAFEVRFLPAKSILLILNKSLFAHAILSTSIFKYDRGVKVGLFNFLSFTQKVKPQLYKTRVFSD
jgi:hypothetical protein